MKKTFTLLMAMVLGMVLSNRVMAQEEGPDLTGWDLDHPLITDISQVSSNSTDRAEGSLEALIDDNVNTFWHADWHGDATKEKPYNFKIEFDAPLDGIYGLKIGRRHNSGTCHPISINVDGEINGSWVTLATLDVPFNGQGTIEYPEPVALNGAKKIRVTMNALNSGENTWHMSEFQMYNVTSQEGAISALMQVYTKYVDLLPLNVGTATGQYGDTEAYAVLEKALETAGEYISNEDFPSYEEINALCHAIVTNYYKVLASEVLFQAKEGYFRIMSALKYKEDVETGETDIDGNPVTETTFVDKAMYSTLQGGGRWGTKDETDCRQVWQLTPGEDGVTVQNIATDMQFVLDDPNAGAGPQAAAGGLLMATEGNLQKLQFDYVGTNDEGKDIVIIRYACHNRDKNIYFHQQYHSKGTGKEGPLCTWQNTYDMGAPYESDKGTSEWYLEEVSPEEAQALIDAFALIKNHDQMVINYRDSIEVAKNVIEVAKDLRGVYEPNTDAPVIQETSWFHSVSSDPDEGSLDNLLDGNNGTFWHSNWHDGNHGAHYHSLDVCFPEPITGWYETYIIRRSGQNSNNWVEVSLYGTNDESLLENVEDAGWELICKTVSTPYTNGQYDQYSQPFEVTKAYKYWRFYEDMTGSQNGYNNCGHLGDFQIYPANKVRKSQYDGMGEVATNLEALIALSETIADEDLTVEQYDALCEALAAVKALVVDPSVLMAAVKDAKTAVTKSEIGNDLGCWKDETALNALNTAIQNAEAYHNSGEFTKAKSDEMVESVNQAVEAYWAAINPIRTDKWYTLGFSSQEVFEANGWASDGKSGLYGAVAVPAARSEEGDAISNSQPSKGSELFFVTNVQKEEEVAHFRFVPVEEGKWALQHRTSGMYICRTFEYWSQGAGFYLGFEPVYFTPTFLGKGQTLLTGFRLEDDQTYERCNINGWNNNQGSLLAGWDDYGMGGNSSLNICEIADIEEEENSTTIQMVEGELQLLCYPVPMSFENPKVTQYTAAGCYEEDGTKYLALNVAEEGSKAGQPFFLIAKGDAVNADETLYVDAYAGAEVAKTPGTDGPLVGAYISKQVPAGDLLFVRETEEETGALLAVNQVVSDGKKQTGDNAAYVTYATTNPDDYDIAIALDENIKDNTADAIKDAMANVAKPGNVYNAAGQLVRKNATLSDVKALGRGLYILNGTKIMVK